MVSGWGWAYLVNHWKLCAPSPSLSLYKEHKEENDEDEEEKKGGLALALSRCSLV